MIHVVIHILPQEIDQLELLLTHMKRTGVKNEYFLDITLNMNLTNWKNSYLHPEFFINKIKDLKKLTITWADCSIDINQNGSILGCNDARRRAIRGTKYPWIMYLDSDNIFSDTLLKYMVMCTKKYSINDLVVFTPEVTKMWDDTWDVITNDNWLLTLAGHEYYDTRDPYEAINNDNEREIKKIDTFKFAGWGTTISSKLAKFIDIPDSLGSYGLDDTFIMACCQYMKLHDNDVNQYVIKNEIIIENNKFRFNPYKDYLSNIHMRSKFSQRAADNFNPECVKFINKLLLETAK